MTPERAQRRHAVITQRQKQALIDNLQLEITERARKLRAQYALQAQSLHTRIELRVNRIPTALRKITMGELLERHAVGAKNKPSAKPMNDAKSVTKASKATNANLRQTATIMPTSRNLKRSSDVMENDKENTPDPNQPVANPKKRTKADNDRRVPNPAAVLSPKSSNSRNVPQSPIRAQLASTQKTASSRPASPLKPYSPVKATPLATTGTSNSAGDRPRGRPATGTAGSRKATANKTTAEVKPYTGRAKRGLAVTGGTIAGSDRAVSNSSTISGASASTTIVKRVGRALTTASTARGAKKTAATTTTAAAKKTTTAKSVVSTSTTAATGATKRTLRKRT